MSIIERFIRNFFGKKNKDKFLGKDYGEFIKEYLKSKPKNENKEIPNIIEKDIH